MYKTLRYLLFENILKIRQNGGKVVYIQQVKPLHGRVICMVFILSFFVAYMAITLSPLASVHFCAAHFFFYFGRAPLYPFISWLNQLSNYLIGIVNVTAYTIMFTTMFIKGSLTFKTNSEIRMTAQAAVVSVFELMFFVYWEYVPSVVLPDFWRRAVDGYSILIYYDVLILPYMIFNKSIKTEMKKLFCKDNSTTPLVVSLERPKGLQRQSI
ncbi:hypothetical protein OSTOST_04011 [Ostertagia ostertagi]